MTANIIMYDEEVQAAAEKLADSFKTMADTMANVPPDFKLMVKMKKLSDEELDRLWALHAGNVPLDDETRAFARMIETAHNIA